VCPWHPAGNWDWIGSEARSGPTWWVPNSPRPGAPISPLHETRDPRRHLVGVLANSALSLLTALPRFLLAALSLLLARLLLSAAALLAALATLLAALSRLLARLLLSGAALLAALLAWLFIRVHNCSFVSSLPTTKPRPLSFLRTLVRKRTIRPVESRGVKL
jgi:hypothetical protein